jgi:hypothetical protein
MIFFRRFGEAALKFGSADFSLLALRAFQSSRA